MLGRLWRIVRWLLSERDELDIASIWKNLQENLIEFRSLTTYAIGYVSVDLDAYDECVGGETTNVRSSR